MLNILMLLAVCFCFIWALSWMYLVTNLLEGRKVSASELAWESGWLAAGVVVRPHLLWTMVRGMRQ